MQARTICHCVTHLSHMPVAEFIVELLILCFVQKLLQLLPPATNCLGRVANAAFLFECLGDEFVSVVVLLQLNDPGVIFIVVGFDRSRNDGQTSCSARRAPSRFGKAHSLRRLLFDLSIRVLQLVNITIEASEDSSTYRVEIARVSFLLAIERLDLSAGSNSQVAA